MQRTIDPRPRRSPAQTRSRNTVAVILEAAARCFAEDGYAGSTTNHIAERAGVSVGSLYEYFASKDAILIALVEAHLAEGKRVLRDATAGLARTPEGLQGTVRAIVRATVKVHALAPDLHRVFSNEALRSRRVQCLLKAIEQEAIGWWERYLREQQEITIRDPRLAATVVFHNIDAMIHRVVIQGDGSIPVERYVEEMVALIAGYLRAPR